MVDGTDDAPANATSRPTRATLPADRAFVVQLRADADLDRGLVRGRVEHMSSGVAALFESAQELVGCMRDAVGRLQKPCLRASKAVRLSDGDAPRHHPRLPGRDVP
jgi:hypothetical protein